MSEQHDFDIEAFLAPVAGHGKVRDPLTIAKTRSPESA